MKVLIFRVLVDILEIMLFMIASHDPKKNYTWKNWIDVVFTVSLCGVINTGAMYYQVMYDYGSMSVSFPFSVTVTILIFKSLLMISFLYDNEGTGLYLSVQSVILLDLFRLAAQTLAQWIRVTYFFDITAVESNIGNVYLSIHMTEELLYLFIFGIIGIYVRKFLVSLRKMPDSSLGVICMMSLIALFYEMTVQQSYTFLDYHKIGLFGHVYKSMPTHNISSFMANLVGFYVTPGIILLLLYQMAQTFEAKIQEAQIRNTLRLNREQLKLIQYSNGTSLHEKHDIAEHLNVIKMFMEKGEIEAVKLYIQKTTGSLYNDSAVYCINPYINAVLNYKLKSAPDIHFTVESSIGENNKIDAVDLGILLMNMIDLRINEIHKHDLKKEISLNITKREQVIVMCIDSEISERHITDNPLEVSVIENIVHKYKGSVVYGVHNNSDMVVMLNEENCE